MGPVFRRWSAGVAGGGPKIREFLHILGSNSGWISFILVQVSVRIYPNFGPFPPRCGAIFTDSKHRENALYRIGYFGSFLLKIRVPFLRHPHVKTRVRASGMEFRTGSLNDGKSPCANNISPIKSLAPRYRITKFLSPRYRNYKFLASTYWWISTLWGSWARGRHAADQY